MAASSSGPGYVGTNGWVTATTAIAVASTTPSCSVTCSARRGAASRSRRPGRARQRGFGERRPEARGQATDADQEGQGGGERRRDHDQHGRRHGEPERALEEGGAVVDPDGGRDDHAGEEGGVEHDQAERAARRVGVARGGSSRTRSSQAP